MAAHRGLPTLLTGRHGRSRRGKGRVCQELQLYADVRRILAAAHCWPSCVWILLAQLLLDDLFADDEPAFDQHELIALVIVGLALERIPEWYR